MRNITENLFDRQDDSRLFNRVLVRSPNKKTAWCFHLETLDCSTPAYRYISTQYDYICHWIAKCRYSCSSKHARGIYFITYLGAKYILLLSVQFLNCYLLIADRQSSALCFWQSVLRITIYRFICDKSASKYIHRVLLEAHYFFVNGKTKTRNLLYLDIQNHKRLCLINHIFHLYKNIGKKRHFMKLFCINTKKIPTTYLLMSLLSIINFRIKLLSFDAKLK